MAARTPKDAHRLFVEAFNAADLDALVALYEPEAVMIDDAGIVHGRQAIRHALQGFLSARPRMELETKSVVQSGDLALLRADWRIRGTAPDGKSFETSHHSSEVVRRQADDTWLYVIDHPFGAD